MKALNALLFYILLYLRRPMIWVLRVIGGISLVGVIVSAIYYFDGAPEVSGWYPIVLTILAFLSFVFARLYDQLLLKLNPHDSALILEQ